MEIPNTNFLRIERFMTAMVFGKNSPAGGLRSALQHAGLDDANRLLQTAARVGRWKQLNPRQKDHVHEAILIFCPRPRSAVFRSRL